MDRRLFLLASAATLPAYAGPLITFSSEEAKLIGALTDRIIPADDAPGALAAGVIFYIDQQLAGPLKPYADEYRNGIPKFQAACIAGTGKSFLQLEAAAQDSFLATQQRDAFFNMVVDHTMQGFYGSPEHGGNKGEASWKMLGIEDVMAGHRH